MSIDARGCYRHGSERPRAPWPKSKAVINLDWHHIIPHAMMRDCWNALAKSQQLGKCQVALESYLRILKVENPRAIVRAMAGGSLSLDEQDLLDSKLCWPGWNIVEGPARRSDDLKNKRTLDAYSSGITLSEWNRQQKLRDLFIALTNFNEASAGGRLSEEVAQNVANVMNTLERTLLAGDVIYYRPAMWVESKPPRDASLENQQLKWWKKKPGESFVERCY